jgi:Domain of unknown function (DUF4351)
MPYVTSIERRGRVEECQSMVLEQLTSLLGEIPAVTEQQIQGLAQESLKSLSLALLGFRTMDDLVQWLATQSEAEDS